ncbi:MAG: STAS domain-containing protein [Nitrospirae bacterium]|nr:STAS domain-containing protein [Nitrospirota bacterium]
MDFKVESSGQVGVLTLDGDLTISRADELRTALMKSLDSVDHLVINLDGFTELDLSCFQLLCSAHRTIARQNKRLTLAGEHLDDFRRIVRAAGFMRSTGCIMDMNKDCLWIGGK